MNTAERAPRRVTTFVITITVITITVIAGPLAVWAPVGASTSAPPTTDPGAGEQTTLPPLTFENGTFTAPDGSFTSGFATVPRQVIDADNGIESYLTTVDEDSQSVVLFQRLALGATASSTAAERAELFLASSGTRIETLANTPTNLGPYPASHFAARLTLADGRRAVVYALVVDRGSDVVYTFYTDVGDDDNAAGTAFVQSFAIAMDQPPAPTITTNVPASVPAGSEPTTIAAAPDGALLGFDGRWWISYPDGIVPAFRASTEAGYAYAEYVAVDGDDTLVVRVTEVPTGFEWDAEAVPAAAAERIGGRVVESNAIDVAARRAVRFTLAEDDNDTVQELVVNGGGQIYSVSFEDGGTTSTEAAEEFIESFGLA